MKIVRQIPLEFESDDCTEKELEAAAEHKLGEIRKEIGLSGIFPLWGDTKKKVIWHLLHDESITAVSHKGGRCIHPDGPAICLEGDCSDCVYFSLKKRIEELKAEKKQMEEVKIAKEKRIEESKKKLLDALELENWHIKRIPKNAFKIYSDYTGLSIDELKAFLTEEVRKREKEGIRRVENK